MLHLDHESHGDILFTMRTTTRIETLLQIPISDHRKYANATAVTHRQSFMIG